MSLTVSGVDGSVSQVSFNGKRQKSGKGKQFLKSATGIAAGATIYTQLPKLIKKMVKPYGLKVAEELSNACPPSEVDAVSKAVKTAFEQTGLKANGFKIHNVNSMSSLKVVSKDMGEKIDKIVAKKLDKIKKILPEKLTNKLPFERMASPGLGTEIMLSEPLKMALDGKNAFCAAATKDIVVNLEKMPMSTFHEMGHAVNSTKTLGKILQSSAGPLRALAIPLIVATALLKRKKADGEKPQGAFDKTTTFVKENAGKLTFAAWVPTLLEEGMASIRGAKMAKAAGLSSDLLKNLNKGNAKAFSTYLIGAVATAAVVSLAVFVKDKIAESKGKKEKSQLDLIEA